MNDLLEEISEEIQKFRQDPLKYAEIIESNKADYLSSTNKSNDSGKIDEIISYLKRYNCPLPIQRENIIDQLIQEYILEKQSENTNNISFNEVAKRKIKFNRCEFLKRVEDKPIFILINLLTESGNEISKIKEILLSQEYNNYGLGIMNENGVNNIIIVLMDNYELLNSKEPINNDENLNNNNNINNNLNPNIDILNINNNINLEQINNNFDNKDNGENISVNGNLNNNENLDNLHDGLDLKIYQKKKGNETLANIKIENINENKDKKQDNEELSRLKETRSIQQLNRNEEPEKSKDVFLNVQNPDYNLNKRIDEMNNNGANLGNNIEMNPNNNIPIQNNNNVSPQVHEETGSSCDCDFALYIIYLILSKIGIFFLIFILISFINVSILFVYYMAGMSFFFSLWFALIDYIFCGCCSACGIKQLGENCCFVFFVGIGCSLLKWNCEQIRYFCQKLFSITPYK